VSQDVEEKTKKKKRENEGEIEGVERGGWKLGIEEGEGRKKKNKIEEEEKKKKKNKMTGKKKERGIIKIKVLAFHIISIGLPYFSRNDVTKTDLLLMIRVLNE
jgi:hypothetical protein